MFFHVHIPDLIYSEAGLILTPRGRLEGRGVSRIWDQAMAAVSGPGVQDLTTTINSHMCSQNEKP